MTQDRIGTAVLVAAAGWLGFLIADLPSWDVEVPWRYALVWAVISVLLLAVFPQRLQLSGTVLAFAVVGICLNLSIFEYEALGWKGIVPTVLVTMAVWLRRSRLDLTDVVGVSAVVAFGIAVVQPNIVMFAFLFIAIVNIVIWALNKSGGSRG